MFGVLWTVLCRVMYMCIVALFQLLTSEIFYLYIVVHSFFYVQQCTNNIFTYVDLIMFAVLFYLILSFFQEGFLEKAVLMHSGIPWPKDKWVSSDQRMIKNRAPHGAGLVPTGLYFLLPVMSINLQVLAGSGGMIVLWLNRVYLETRELNPRSSINLMVGRRGSTRLWSRSSELVYLIDKTIGMSVCFTLSSHTIIAWTQVLVWVLLFYLMLSLHARLDSFSIHMWFSTKLHQWMLLKHRKVRVLRSLLIWVSTLSITWVRLVIHCIVWLMIFVFVMPAWQNHTLTKQVILFFSQRRKWTWGWLAKN